MPYVPPLLPSVPIPAVPPDLPVRAETDQGGPDHVTKASVVSEDARGLTLSGVTVSGKPVSIAVRIVAPGIVRVLLEGEDADANRTTLARDLSAQPAAASLEKATGQRTLVTDLVRVKVRLDPFHITFYGPDGRVMLDQNYTDSDVADNLIVLPFGFSEVEGQRVAFHDTFTAEPDEHFFGFGEKFSDFDKRGQRLEMWNYEAHGVHSERAYKNVPFFVSTRGYGIFVDSASPVQFDMASSNFSTFNLIVPDTALDYYVIAGPELKAVISRYADLVSLPILPPKWAFGLWMSSGFKADSTEEVLERARTLRERDLPCDVLHLDCYWQRWGRWSDLQWDTDVFPDPEGLLKAIKAQGFKICLWINPYIGVESPLFEEAKAKGYFLKTPDGEAWVGDQWGGYHPPVAVIDVTNPEAAAWFKDLLRKPLSIGADVYKSDFGEGVPADTVAHNGMTGVQLHNLYTLIYNDLVVEVTKEIAGHEMVWGRSTYAGGQRHAAQWGGDTNCTYMGMASTLRGGLSMGVCGHAFWSHDIGGFHREPTPDLYTRWVQFGAFTPMARCHGITTRLPWDYGEEAVRVFDRYMRLRYRLLPYLYTYGCLAHETSLPILSAMVVEFPDDPNTYTMDLQYMFGAELMVAPIFNIDGYRSVYFPAGRWIDYWTHEVITGPQTRFVQAPLDVMPMYVRADSLIPTAEPKFPIADGPFDLVTFDAYLLGRSGAFTLHDTDGATTVTATVEDGRLNIQVEGAKRALGLRLVPLPGTAAISAVYVNGAPLDKRDLPNISADAQAGWARDQSGALHAMIRRA